ncbi:MAG: hypothetical protein JOZ77_04155 [Candidatus Eremiobacteraeota bacterium]|nr:hypothetical protein [Candidatus Eremiobacteraeota bacterium]
MIRPTIFAAALVSLALCACSGNRIASPAGVVPQLSQELNQGQPQSGIVPDTGHKISGTYKGTVTGSAKGQKQNGTIKVIITQKKKNVSGPVYLTFDSDTQKYAFSGKITSRKKNDTSFTFAVEGGSGHASVIGKVLKGTAKVTTSSGITVTFTYKATR